MMVMDEEFLHFLFLRLHTKQNKLHAWNMPIHKQKKQAYLTADTEGSDITFKH